MRAADYVPGLDEPPGERRNATGSQAQPVPELARRETAEHHEVLEGGELDLMESQLPRPSRALVLARQLDAVQEHAEALDLSFWLCTHWLASSRMPRVSPVEQFARNLRRRREAAGLSQQQLADRTGLHPTEISRLERAAREPRLGTMVRLAQGLDIGIEKLVTDIR
jgi:DNA-binding XRE family transcriptional regulator